MDWLRFILESRGPVNLVKRSFQIASRFGVTPERMGKRFDRFMEVLDESGCRPTFPITALPLHRNPRFAHRLLDRGAELAVHAYTHVDLTQLSYEDQRDNLGRAIEMFRKDAVPFTGFRAPYLHWNDDTMRAVDAHGFQYSSNEAVIWDVIDLEPLGAEQRRGLEYGKAFYKPHPADKRIVLPFRRRGFIEIPVSLPDDEILLDRMYMHDPDDLGSVWRRVVEKTYERGELFTVQLHPERIDFFGAPLSNLLLDCRRKSPGVWIATLGEIARWWRDKAMNSADILREGEGHRVKVTACEGSVLLVRENGRERSFGPGDLRVAGERRPCAGVSARSDGGALERLRDVGYILETSEDVDAYAVHLGALAGGSDEVVREAARAIDRCPGPLVRFGTWPRGNRSALAVTGDIDALTLWDFVKRFRGE